MTPEVVLSIFGEAFWLIVLLVSVIIVPSLIVGLIVSTFQAATQINEQTLSFLPRLSDDDSCHYVGGALDPEYLDGAFFRIDQKYSISYRLALCSNLVFYRLNSGSLLSLCPFFVSHHFLWLCLCWVVS